MTDTTHSPSPATKSPARLSRAIALGVSAAIIMAVVLVSAMSATLMGGVARDGFIADARIITELQAMTTGGGVRFGKTEILKEQFDGFRESHSRSLVAIGAWNVEGASVALSGEMGADAAALAAKAVEGGESVSAQDGLLQASPTRFGKNNDVVGAIVAQWSDARAAADIRGAAVTVGMVGLGIAVAFGVLATIWTCIS